MSGMNKGKELRLTDPEGLDKHVLPFNRLSVQQGQVTLTGLAHDSRPVLRRNTAQQRFWKPQLRTQPCQSADAAWQASLSGSRQPNEAQRGRNPYAHENEYSSHRFKIVNVGVDRSFLGEACSLHADHHYLRPGHPRAAALHPPRPRLTCSTTSTSPGRH